MEFKNLKVIQNNKHNSGSQPNVTFGKTTICFSVRLIRDVDGVKYVRISIDEDTNTMIFDFLKQEEDNTFIITGTQIRYNNSLKKLNLANKGTFPIEHIEGTRYATKLW